ncbi:GNAT family N-acetyltransferase [Pedobacter xixiisoli]|uniref:Protein N-acetyltransferase, RimJ/RimL family n=1 Tax=Pedobacter xixiisoli TaxID=1476464 RepID=A0A285ZPS8_9SPHI|nr:GNAT family N-acetyltransferase [Pedobacter xixiisoli]SOD11630.1 Protein N-acetyltransferase, RimJ/RimL family [Pedobacter xixiisoli]
MAQIIIETERFYIRPLVAEDAAGIFELDSNTNVHTYLGNHPIKTFAEAENTIRLIQKQYEDLCIGRWAIIEKSTGNFVGWTGFKLITELTNNHVNYHDLGYRLIEKYWGKGVATETAKACLKYAFETLKLEVVYGICDVDNIASKNILQKCGLQVIETFNYDKTPHYWLRVFKEEWEKQNN